MAIVTPYIPQRITVHLGKPDEAAENITVDFVDYVKNVACSEIYPTWEESALRANILAIMSYALNRVYTEYYPSRGYDFDITNTTARDQAFVSGRSYFENISRLVDEMLGSYIRRQGSVEPLAAKFCNGTTSTCDGLSQWGSQELAREGYGALDILRRYQPQALSLEKLFYQHNQTTVIGVAEARGVILLAAAQAGVPVYEYTPMQVKQAVTGYGKAVKRQIQEMTRTLLKLPAIPKPDDTADALAMAVTHCHCSRSQLLGAAPR